MTAFPSLQEASLMVQEQYMNGKSFDEIEKQLRSQNSFIFLFGEDPEKSNCLKGCDIHNDLPFVLRISIRTSRDIACKMDIESGCHDVNVNLQRLKQTGFVVMKNEADPKEFAAKEVTRLCEKAS